MDSKTYYQINRERILKRQKARYWSNHDLTRRVDNAYRAEYRKRPHVKASRKDECRKQYQRNPDVQRRYWLKQHYGITLEQYNDLLVAQGGVCAICKGSHKFVSRWGTKVRHLHIDHCHKTKKVRGLLCHHCNSAIGHFRDKVENLESAILYLQLTS